MKGRIILAVVAVSLGIAAAGAAPSHAGKTTPAAASTPAEQLIRNCKAHKFETVVQELVDGQPHQSKVKLCGKEGQSDAEWVGTLKDAISKLNANKEMPPAVRQQIVVALNSEITRLQTPVPLLPRRSTGSKSAIDALAPLPPLPRAKIGQSASLPPPRQSVSVPLSDDYAVLPTIPTAPPPPVQVLSGAAGASLPLLPKPRMTLTCYTPGEAEGPCTGFTRDTQVTVHAGEDLPAGTSLRFVRDGDPKADVDLTQLKKGRAARFDVPVDVCRHAVGGKLELRVVRSGQEVGTDGPYNLSC